MYVVFGWVGGGVVLNVVIFEDGDGIVVEFDGECDGEVVVRLFGVIVD